MAFGYCVRVLLLSLLALSKHTGALTYRSSSSSGIKPYFGMAEDFPHSYKSAPRYESSVQPRSYLGVYDASHGSPLQHGSASSYRPGSLSSSRPRQPHKQTHYQGKTDGVLQPQDAMWDFAVPQKGNRLEIGGVSNYATEPQQLSNEQQPRPRPQHPNYEASKPRPRPQHPNYEASKPRPWPQHPNYEASKPRPWPQHPNYEASKPRPRHPNYEASKPRPRPQHPNYEASKPQPQPRPLPQQPSSEVSKPHLHPQPLPQPRPLPQQPSSEVSKPHLHPQPRPLPQQPSSEACKPRPQPRPLPQQSSYEDRNPPSAGVLQTKAGIWDLAINSNAGPRSFRPVPMASGYQYRWPHHLAPFYSRYQS